MKTNTPRPESLHPKPSACSRIESKLLLIGRLIVTADLSLLLDARTPLRTRRDFPLHFEIQCTCPDCESPHFGAIFLPFSGR